MARPAGAMLPAGQSTPGLSQFDLDAALAGADPNVMSFTTGEAGITNPASYNAQTGETTHYDASGNVTGTTQGLSVQQENQLFSVAGSALHQTGDAIAAIIRGNDATRRQQLTSDVLTEMTRLQTQLQTARAHGNTIAAQQAANQIASLQDVQRRLQPKPWFNLGDAVWGIGAVIVALGVGGFFVLRNRPSGVRASSSSRRASKRSRRSNPSNCGCPRRKV